MSVNFYVAKQGPKYTEPAFDWDHESNLNVANGNVGVILGVVGLDNGDYCGTLTPAQCRLIADNLEENLGNIRPESVEYGARGAKVINCGLSLDRIRRYCEALRNLANLAEIEETYLIAYS